MNNETYRQYQQTIEKGLTEMLPLIEQAYLPGRAPRRLTEAMRYSALGGGKRVRGVLLLAAMDMLEGDPVEGIPFAVALEMIHAYSLVHDDLPGMDDDDMRRGKPSNHKVFGEGMAILAGDGLLSLAHEIMTETCLYSANPKRMLKAMLEVTRAAGVTGMVAGQCIDLEAEGKPPDKETLQYIHQHKTGALLTAPLLVAARLCDAYQSETDALERFGYALGMAFQMKDDLLDIEGEAASLGKQTGMDAQRGKLTYPALYGVEETRRMAQAQTDAALSALSMFGQRAEFLRGLCGDLLGREA